MARQGEAASPPRRGPRAALGILSLLAAPLAPFLFLPVGAALLVVFAWLARIGQPPRRERLTVAPLMLAAAAMLVGAWLGGLAPEPSPERWHRHSEVRYNKLWRGLEGAATQGADVVGHLAPVTDDAQLLEAHGALARLASETRPGDLTFLLVNPDGEAAAWGGRGLLQEPRPGELPRHGPAHVAGFGTATLLSVIALSGEARPWRMVAGRSLPTDHLPFRAPGGRGQERPWSLVAEPERAAPGATVLLAEGAPAMILDRPLAEPPPGATMMEAARRGAWALVAAALLAVAVMRGVGLALLSGTRIAGTFPPATVAALIPAGVAALALAAGVSGPGVGVLAAGTALGTFGLLTTSGWGGAPRSFLGGAAGMLALLAAQMMLQGRWRLVDLGSASWGGAEVAALRLGGLGAAMGLLALAGARPGDRPRSRMAFSASGALLAAAIVHDHTLVAAAFLALGGGCVALWLMRSAWRQEPGRLVILALLAALAAAASWETAHRWAFRNALERDLLPAMAPPRQQEVMEVWEQIEDHFAHLDLSRLALTAPDGLRLRDLGYVLWRGSPLARRDALSAVVVLPPLELPVAFSYGLPLTDDGFLDPELVRWQGLDLPAWRESLLSGEIPLLLAGEPWGRLRYWLQPVPGFRLGAAPVGELAAALLRGGPAVRAPTPALPEAVRYALYDHSGRPLVSPWAEAPPLPEALLQPSAVVDTPEGPAWGFSRRGVDGYQVLLLPRLAAVTSLERVGGHTLGLLILLSGAGLLGLLLGLTRAAFRDALRRSVRSYSKRLLMVYGTLLLLPLLLLNLGLFRAIEERLAVEQRAAGSAALDSAQQVLGEYVLSLDPGFGLETALDDDLLVWLSRVIHHEVNLYWGSRINASSKRELFTAGLLPDRIPGEIYSRLSLLGYELASRTSRAGPIPYLELYAPVRVPGVSPAEHQLYLSLPLLAQQEEAARELGRLKRRGILITAALALLAAAVGTRLARNFTHPLQELVAGTRRIATGATSLDLAPTELELAALVEAIDDMARRIDEARQRLVREKQVMESMVQNITSGIVSLDPQGRVLLENRAATELLGVQVGADLRGAVTSVPGMEPVARFLEGVGAELSEATVRLVTPAGDEREYRLVWVPIPGSGAPAALLVVEDATEILRSQRLQAWAEMARIIAHEVKNPLTPIRLSTEHLQEVYRHDPARFDQAFERCTANILRQVDELHQIATEFSTYSHIPRLDRRPGDLRKILMELAEAYGAAPAKSPRVELEGHEGPLQARFDERMLRRAVRNLVENALRASSSRGQVTLRLERDHGEAAITVADRGPGVSTEELPRIFDPYFSTHDTGTGLGLPIARRIAEEHGGTIQARNREGGGLEVTIRIPLS